MTRRHHFFGALGHTLACLTALIAWSSPASAQSAISDSDSSTAPPRSVFVEYELLATKASVGDKASVRAFASNYLSRSIAFNAAPSVAERIVASEMAFRSGRQPAISNGAIVDTVNDIVRRIGAPDYLRTNLAQVRLCRSMLEARVPHLNQAAEDTKSSDDMSPSEAAFILAFLSTQKVLNGNYQVPPDQWAREYTEYRDAVSLSNRGVQMKERPRRWELPPTLSIGLRVSRGENSALTEAVRTALDTLGLSR